MKYGITLIIILLAFGCSYNRNNEWGAVDKDTDSVFRLFLTSFINGYSSDSLNCLADSLIKLSTFKNREVRARALYCKTIALIKSHAIENAETTLSKALDLQDSVNYPYSNNRMKCLRPVIELRKTGPSARIYLELEKFRKYFSHKDDLFEKGLMENTIGLMFHELNDLKLAEEYFLHAQKSFMASGVRGMAKKHILNIAQSHLVSGDTAYAIRQLNSLLADSSLCKDRIFRHNVLTCLYEATENPSFLSVMEENLKGIKHIPPGYESDMELLMGHASYKKGLFDKAAEHTRKALSLSANDNNKTNALYLYAYIYSTMEEYDSAWQMMSLRDSILNIKSNIKHIREIKNIHSLHDIYSARKLLEEERFKKRMTIMGISSGLIILIVFIVVIFYRKNKKLRLLAQIRKDEIGKKRKQLAAISCSLEDKAKALEEMKGIITENPSSNVNVNRTIIKIEQLLNNTANSNKDWENMKMLSDSIHPDFEYRLCKSYPTLSDNLIKTASYIACGLDSKQIARIMNIQPDSVKKNRWRLRKELKLDTGEDLYRFFNDFIEKNRDS